jgi:hypothetical protein
VGPVLCPLPAFGPIYSVRSAPQQTFFRDQQAGGGGTWREYQVGNPERHGGHYGQTTRQVQSMLNIIKTYWRDNRDRQRINIALSKGASMMAARNINLRNPGSWEFSGFSQNGEDGIIDVLRRNLLISNRYFIEIGSADGIDNNTAWLLIAEKYNGIMIDGNSELIKRAKRMVINYSIGAECYNLFITKETVSTLKSLALHIDPDVLSLDIDGNDYYVANALIEVGFRPKIFVVEYNSVYGSERCCTIKYDPVFEFSLAHPTGLYYGVSIGGWRKFFASNGYHFITVDRNGVNAFFADINCFDHKFLNQIDPLNYAENQLQLKNFRMTSDKQFKLIVDKEFIDI